MTVLRPNLNGFQYVSITEHYCTYFSSVTAVLSNS